MLTLTLPLTLPLPLPLPLPLSLTLSLTLTLTKVSCPDFRVRVQPMHVTLLGRLQSIYFTYSGIAWERVQQVNEGAGFPHNLPTEVRHVVSSLGMPKVLMLLAEQHCDLAMRTDGTLRGDDPRTHPLGELCKASAQLEP